MYKMEFSRVIESEEDPSLDSPTENDILKSGDFWEPALRLLSEILANMEK